MEQAVWGLGAFSRPTKTKMKRPKCEVHQWSSNAEFRFYYSLDPHTHRSYHKRKEFLLCSKCYFNWGIPYINTSTLTYKLKARTDRWDREKGEWVYFEGFIQVP